MSSAAPRVSVLDSPFGGRSRPSLSGPVRRTMLVCLACSTVLVPWVAYLATSLPETYVMSNWSLAWVGFDVMLILLLGGTGLLVRREHPMQVAAAFLSAAFLLADAWFDVMTSTGSGLVVSLVSAVFIELPLAVFLLRYATRIITAATAPRG
ncbi:MAG TPA: hypothetical protein VGN48_05800 [Pedococcus sp.]|jgi:Na+-translocating ferredoxin:NAD+ oxidoreductase RnfD subunit|nr:hypothetical protein [Pedococcus sp.]